MKESIGYTYLLNMMIVFIFVSFSVILFTLSYYKAYTLSSKIADIIEEAEGYNEYSKARIDRLLSSMGYQRFNVSCKKKSYPIMEKQADDTVKSVSIDVEPVADTFGFCLYEVGYVEDTEYYFYGITTYMMFDFPLVDRLRLPVNNTTDKIYKFS